MLEPEVLDEDAERERNIMINFDIGRWLAWLATKRESAVMLDEIAMIEQIEAHFVDVLDRGDYDEDQS